MSNDLLTKIHSEMVKTRYVTVAGKVILLVFMLLLWRDVITNRGMVAVNAENSRLRDAVIMKYLSAHDFINGEPIQITDDEINALLGDGNDDTH